MKRIALFLSLFCMSAGAAELRLEKPGVQITLLDTPCKHGGVLAMLQPDKRQLYQEGSAKLDGKVYEMCWRISPDGQDVWIIDEEGDTPPGIPIKRLVPKEVI